MKAFKIEGELDSFPQLTSKYDFIDKFNEARLSLRRSPIVMTLNRGWYSPNKWSPSSRELEQYMFGKSLNIKWVADDIWDEAIFWGEYHCRAWTTNTRNLFAKSAHRPQRK